MRQTGRARAAKSLAVLAAGALAFSVLSGCEVKTLWAACNGTLVASQPGTVQDNALTEISGADSSPSQTDVLWVNNDSGDSARLFAISGTGQTLHQYTFTGATAIDWEDISVGPGPTPHITYLYAADIGDNAKTRTKVTIYRVPEPTVTRDGGASALSGVEAIDLQYPDGAHDAEAFVVDPQSGKLIIVAKQLTGGNATVYEAPANLAASSLTTMTAAGTVVLGAGLANAVTDLDTGPVGLVLALRTYGAVHVFARTGTQTMAQTLSGAACNGPIPVEIQGEAVAFVGDGSALVTISEGAHPVINRYDIPTAP